MKTACCLLFCTSLAQAATVTLPGPGPLPVRLEVTGAEISKAQQLQLQQYLQQQWPWLADDRYWSAAEQFAATGTWPADAVLLHQAWQQCEAWWQQQRSYHCRFGAARKLWRLASQQTAASGELPDRVKLRRDARQLLYLQGDTVRLLPDLQGFAQAVLLDNLLSQAKTLWPGASLQLQFGDWRAQFADTTLAAQAFGQPTQNPLTAIRLQQQVLLQANVNHAVSPDAVWHPLEAWPVQYGPAVAVTSQSFSRAWLLAQALTSASPAQRTQSLQQETDAALWREWQQDPTATPQLQASASWFHQLQAATAYQHSQQLQLQLELPVQPRQAKRPYVSAWLSQDGQWQAQLLLLGEQPRWYAELRSWWRQANQQKGQPFDQLAGATRRAGVHQFQWDARLPDGRPLPAGDYILHLEAAREGGGREQLKLPLHWPLSQALLLQGQHELGQVRVEVRPAGDPAPTAAVHPSG